MSKVMIPGMGEIYKEIMILKARIADLERLVETPESNTGWYQPELPFD